MKYLEFFDLSYKPKRSDLICLYKVLPSKEFNIKEASARVASESSVGTWAEELKTETKDVKKRLNRIMARVFYVEDGYAKIAYPIDLWEVENFPQLLSGICGNIFGMKALKGLRLEDVKFPKKFLKFYKGCKFGIKGIRKIFGIYDRPLTATVPKPKIGLNVNQFCDAAYKIWKGGIDFVKWDENLTSLNFVKFYKLVEKIHKVKNKVEKEVKENKQFLPNVTSNFKEMEKRVKFVYDIGNKFVMVDFLTIGFSSFQSIVEICKDYDLAVYCHRAFHSTFTRNKDHGISMLCLAKFVRLIGGDTLHVGGMGKLVSPKEEIYVLANCLRKKIFKQFLGQDWLKLKPTFPVCSGGLHPGIIPRLIKFLGKDIILQVGGGVVGHPKGIEAGAKAVRQAIEASLKGVDLEEYSKNKLELSEALKEWKKKTFV